MITDGMRVANTLFQSTLSLRRATGLYRSPAENPPISIHALLAESDTKLRTIGKLLDEFQSTLSLRRATSHRNWYPRSPVISIHALLAESDRDIQSAVSGTLAISIHALLAESDP